MQWTKNELTGHAHAEVAGRAFDIQSAGRMKELWYGREGRRIRLGAFRNETEAKTIAQDIADSLVRQRKILGEDHV